MAANLVFQMPSVPPEHFQDISDFSECHGKSPLLEFDTPVEKTWLQAVKQELHPKEEIAQHAVHPMGLFNSSRLGIWPDQFASLHSVISPNPLIGRVGEIL